MSSKGLNIDTISEDLSFLLESEEIGHNVLGEAVLSGNEDVLATRELPGGTKESLLGVLNVLLLGSNGHKHLTNAHTSGLAESLSVGMSHTLLESISSSTGKHLVNTNDVPWVDSDSKMERELTAVDLHVLVGSKTGSFESLGGDLFLLIRDEMDGHWELIPRGLLGTTIVHSDFGVWHTTVES